jgi:hypothetical protein
VPYPELGDRPNVVVDGDGTESSLLTLSHWPGSTVPPSLQADLSAEIAVRYLEQPEQHVPADVVSNNHLDEDGLMGVFALVDPACALAHRDLLVDVARAGDFAWSHTREAARVAFTLGSMLDARPVTGSYDDYCAQRHEELLPLVPRLLADIGAFRDDWAAEDEFLDASSAAIDDGTVSITEHPELDLAIVTMPARPERTFHRFTQRRTGGLHPMAVHNRTERTRVAYLQERRYWMELRYESVVQFVSRPILGRPDLGPLADHLNEIESSGGKWDFESIGSLTPKLLLRDADESSLDPATFVAALRAFLADAAPAWDPWAESGFR